jgi:hypothetical protein
LNKEQNNLEEEDNFLKFDLNPFHTFALPEDYNIPVVHNDNIFTGETEEMEFF